MALGSTGAPSFDAGRRRRRFEPSSMSLRVAALLLKLLCPVALVCLVPLLGGLERAQRVLIGRVCRGPRREVVLLSLEAILLLGKLGLEILECPRQILPGLTGWEGQRRVTLAYS